MVFVGLPQTILVVSFVYSDGLLNQMITAGTETEQIDVETNFFLFAEIPYKRFEGPIFIIV